jgi:general secretion pathway protein K
VRLNRLLQLLDIDKQDRDVIVDSIEDWIDDNDEHRANGAESDDHYVTLPVPYRARNADMESVTELLQIKGVTPELFHGTPGRPGLADLLTVVGRGDININTASRLVLATLGVSEAYIVEILATRRERPYTSGELGRFSQYGLVSTTQTYRIEAMGLIDGTPRARVTAVVQVEGEANSRSLRILSWSGIR